VAILGGAKLSVCMQASGMLVHASQGVNWLGESGLCMVLGHTIDTPMEDRTGRSLRTAAARATTSHARTTSGTRPKRVVLLELVLDGSNATGSRFTRIAGQPAPLARQRPTGLICLPGDRTEKLIER
jgi:hypothetical protein